MSRSSSLSRRSFLARGLGATSAALAVPAILRGAAPEKRRVRLAVIGMGNISGAHVPWVRAQGEVTAMCDPDARRLDPTSPQLRQVKDSLPILFPGALRLADYRTLFREHADRFDAVLCCSTDHHHYPIALLALQAGKPVYCEKPLTWSVAEALALREACLRHQLPTQLGNQGVSTNGWCEAAAHLAAGNLGDLTEVHGWIAYRREPTVIVQDYPRVADPVPPELNWDLWAGAGPSVPFKENWYHPGAWRYWVPFGSGLVGDWGCHVFGGLYQALDLPHPERVEVVRRTDFNGITHPRALVLKWTLPATPATKALTLYMHTSRWEDPEFAPPRPPDLEPGAKWPQAEHGCVWVGTKGSYVFLGGHNVNGKIVPESRRRALGPPPGGAPKRVGNAYTLHGEDFLRAVRGETPWHATVSNFNYAGKLTALIQLGNAALRAGHPLRIDARTGWPIDPADHRHCRREQPRPGWPAL